VYNAFGHPAAVSQVSLQEIVGAPFRHQDSAIDVYLRLVRNGVVFDDGSQWRSGSVYRPIGSDDISRSFISSPRTGSCADVLHSIPLLICTASLLTMRERIDPCQLKEVRVESPPAPFRHAI
jgi:hypothetical protein